MADFGSALWNKPAAADSTPDPVTRSLRFDTNGKLSRTFGTPNSKKTFTLAFWVKRAGFSSSAYKEIWQYNRSGRGGGMGFAPTQSNWMDEEEFQFSSRNANTGVADVNIALTTRFRDPAAWMHIALVVDTTLGSSEAADRIKIFVNNERNTNYDTSHTHSYYWPVQNYEFSEIFGGTGAPQNIGLRDTNNHPLNGYLADIYFIDGAAIEPDTNFIESTGYGSYKPKAFDMSSYSGNSFHIDAQPAHDADLLVSSIDRNDGDTLFADAAKGHTITTGGDPEHSIKVGNPFTGDDRAIYFDGSGDYLQTSTNSDLTFGTGDFTVELWFNPASTNTSNSYKGIISDEVYSSTGGWAVSQRDDELSLWIKNTGGSWVSFVADGALTANQWQHIAVSYDSSTTTTRLFVDGTVVASGTTSGWNLTGDQVEIGRSISGQEIAGYLFDVRVTKGQARYTSSFTPPTSKLTADSDTKLLIQPHKDDTDFHDESDSSNTITTYGTPTRKASTPYDAAAKSTAIYYDGNDTHTINTDLAFGTGAFTIEFWYQHVSDINGGATGANADIVISKGRRNTAYQGWLLFTHNNGTDKVNWVGYKVNGSSGTNYSLDANSTGVSLAHDGDWHHIAVTRDGSGNMGLFIDGTRYADATGYGGVIDNSSYAVKLASAYNYTSGATGHYANCYLYDVRITKGEAKYDPLETSVTKPSAPLELNPVYIGGDQSGNKNHFAPTNISMHDVMLDTPTKNYATINPLNGEDSSHAGYGEGNLHITYKNSGQATTFGATMAFPKTGKWYAEVYIKSYGSSDSTRPKIGICRSDYDLTKYNNDTGQLDSADCFHYQKGGNKGGNSAGSSSYGASHTTGDIIGVAFDSDNGTLTFYKNGASQGQAFSGLTKEYILATSGYDTSNSGTDDSVILNFGQDPTFAGNYTETPDSAEWAHSPPTGFKSLNSSNLDAPAVTPADHFNTVLYTGTRDNNSSLGATSNAVTGMGFEPSLLWIKDRDNRSNGYGSSYSGNYLFDSVQGTGKAINIDGNMYTGSNDFVSNLDGYNGVSSFDSDGFTLDEAEAVNYAVDSDWNGSIDTYERYAAWGWKLGSNGSSSTWASGNTNPTTEKYNDSAGVSVIRRTETSGSGTGVTLNHSLGAAPEFAFLKDTVGNTQNVYVWHKDLDANKYLRFNANSAQTTGSGYFPSGCSTATTFQIGSDIAGVNGYDGWWDIYLYLFSGVESHSKFGTFEGNGLSDGPFIYTGFRPRFIMIKSIDDAYAWYIHDTARSPYNYSDNELVADTSGAEYSVSGAGGGERLDILSNGFKHRTSNSAMNQSSRTHIYAAFAESPFKHANAR